MCACVRVCVCVCVAILVMTCMHVQMMTVRFTAAVVTIWSVCLEASAFNAIDSVPSPDAFPIDTTLQCITLSGPEELPNVRLIPVQDSQILQPEPSRYSGLSLVNYAFSQMFH